MDDLASDLLWGASAVSEYVFGTQNGGRKVYHLYRTGQLPLNKIGAELVGSKKTLDKHLAPRHSKPPPHLHAGPAAA